MRLADTAGTVWKGRGLVTNEQRTWSLPVSLEVDPLALARGDVAIHVQAPSGADNPRGDIARRDVTLTLDGVSVSLPAAALNGTIAPGETIALGGILAFDAPHFRWNGRSGDGAATVRWSGARVAGNAATVALGDVTVNLAPREGRIEGRIENRGGDVRIDGEFDMERRRHRRQCNLGSVALDAACSHARVGRAGDARRQRRRARAVAQRRALT